MKYLGATKRVFGIEIYRDRKRSKFCLSQAEYLKKVLIKYGMDQARSASVPHATHFKLSLEQSQKNPPNLSSKNLGFLSATDHGSNPRLEAEQLIDIPVTPTSEVRNSNNINGILSPNPTTAVIIASWYLSNIGVLLLNKYLLSIYGYRYPIFLTLLHMLSCALYSILAIHWLELVPYQPIVSRRQFFKIVALSAIFCFSVVCRNTSLRYLPVSFNPMIGATTPFFTTIFAFIITCKKESCEVYLALVPMVLGIVLASNNEPLFHLFGFLVCVGSTAGSALKSVVQVILLTSEGERLHSMNLLMYMAPMAAVILLPFSVCKTSRNIVHDISFDI
ncbi:probable sugar phosphate/phosphate translocator At1g12500 [Magnolia sinica]|uniref:probable sugar phosphate/phosphate translocator At1g12500 n=1 Tax=Magnolia sinica TaxID=86752 RepID=UPI00265A4818|nr:probable sugar phosphate/phosphate translocator At1g12500 [Magnolia sinica]